MKRRATNKKRTLLRQLGLRQEQLDGVARALLDVYARAASKVELYDDWADEHGYLNDAGEAPPWVGQYFTAINSTRLALARLDDHLRARGQRPKGAALADYLRSVEELDDAGG